MILVDTAGGPVHPLHTADCPQHHPPMTHFAAERSNSTLFHGKTSSFFTYFHY